MADEDARADRAGLGRKLGRQQSVEAHYRLQRRAVARQFEHSSAAHAEADRGKRQVRGLAKRNQRPDRRPEPLAIEVDVLPDFRREAARIVEIGRQPAVKVGNQRDVTGLGSARALSSTDWVGFMIVG